MATRSQRLCQMRALLSHIDIVEPGGEEGLIQTLVAADRTSIVSFLNQHAFNLAYNDPEFSGVLQSAEVLLRDGVGIELGLALLGLPAGKNMNGTDFIPRLLLASKGRRLALFGTREPWLGQAVAALRGAGIEVAATVDGFQPDEKYAAMVESSDPDIVVLAMGMPRQEKLAATLARLPGRPRLIVNGGAILDFYAERFKRAPQWARMLRMEWLFRLFQEPGRLAERYILGGAQFIWRILGMVIAERMHPEIAGTGNPNSAALVNAASHSFEVIIASPGGLAGRGGMASVTRTIDEWISASDRGIEAHVVDTRGIGSSWLWPVYFCGAFVRTLALGLRPGPKVLHLQVSERSSFIRKGLLQSLGHLLGMTTMLHHHGAELIPFYRSAPAPLQWWTRRTICKADLNLVLGQRWQKFLLDEVGADPSRISVLYNASADLNDPVAAARLQLRKDTAEERAFHFLLIANLSPRKGISEFLNAMHRLREEGVNVEATLAGGGEVARYVAEAKALGLEMTCSFTGWVDRTAIINLLASADCLVLPSYEEGLPMVILESLSCHLPVIATPVGSIGELLTSESDCLLVPPGDVDALTSALRRVATDEILRLRMIDEGRKLFEQRFQLDRYMHALLERYATALSAK